MDLVADENVDAPIVAALRAAGHRTVYVQELDPAIDDDLVLAGFRSSTQPTALDRSGSYLTASSRRGSQP